MFTRDLKDKLARRAGDPPPAAAIGRASEGSYRRPEVSESAGQGGRRRQDFAPPQVPPPSGLGVVLWGFQGGKVRGWDRDGQEVVSATWPDADPPAAFVESNGQLYSVHGATSAANKVKRWRVPGPATVADLETLVEGAGIPAGMRFGTSINTGMGDVVLVDPSGAVFLRAVEETKKIQVRWYKVIPPGGSWTLALENDLPLGIEEWLRFVLGADGGAGCGTADEYCTRLAIATLAVSALEKPSRELNPAVLASGRWVAADPLFNFLAHHVDGTFGGWYMTGAEQSALVWYGNPAFPDEFADVFYRAWGDAWWERTVGGWGVVANGGVFSLARKAATTNAPQDIVEDSGGGEGTGITPNFSPAWKGQRVGTLPAVFGRWGGFLNEADTPLQIQGMMRAGPAHVFLHLMGSEDAVSGDFLPGGIHRAAAPAAGAAPSFSQVLAEPDLNDTPQRQWSDFDAAAGRLWITEVEFTGGGAGDARLVSYAPDGTDRRVHTAYPGHIQALGLRAAWAARWK